MQQFINPLLNDLHQLHILKDKELLFIVAINGNKYSQSIGGCRFLDYNNFEEAIIEASKLAKAMYYKNCLFGLPFNGGKAVVLKNNLDREITFSRLGRFINSLSGKYVTGLDVGVSQKDMDIVKTYTEHVAEDCSEATAIGIVESIKQIANTQGKNLTLNGVKISIQGAGKIGSLIAKKLHCLGATLIISDINEQTIDKIKNTLPVKVVEPELIYKEHTDIFCPCALGEIIDIEAARNINCKIILGPANNQLSSMEASQVLWERNILHIPESIVSAGGVIFSSYNYIYKSYEFSMKKIEIISTVLKEYLDLYFQAPEPTVKILNRLYTKKNIRVI
jgi:leucine dehydrogenase